MKRQKIFSGLLIAASLAFVGKSSSAFTLIHTDDIKSQIEHKLSEENDGAKITIYSIKITKEGSNKLVSYNNLTTRKLDLTSFNRDTDEKTFSANFISDGQEKFDIKGKYSEIIEIPVLSEKIQRGEIITESHIKYIDIPENKLRNNTIKQEDNLIGKEAIRTIYAGKPVSSREISEPTAIEKGSIVSLIFRTPNMELKTSGNALESGSIGEIIKVRNDKSGVVVQAMIEKNGNALVNYQPSNSMDIAGNYNIRDVAE